MVAVDGLGNLYIADTINQRIRRVDTSGVITTVAGTGMSGFSGDGGPGTSAQFATPYCVAADQLGTVYVADMGNSRIRRIDTTGMITTIAGSAASGPSGDGGAATSAQLASPYGVAVDSGGNVYVSDTNNHRIYRVDATGVITRVAGVGSGGLSGDGGPATSAQIATPYGIAVDGAGNLYVVDRNNFRIRRIDTTGTITTVAGTTFGFGGDGGPATSAKLSTPSGVAVDHLGNVYITDANRVRVVDANGVITTFAGTGTAGSAGDGGLATSAQLAGPSGVAVDGAGNVFVADTVNSRIRRIDPAGVITTVAGTTSGSSGDGGPATSAQLMLPFAVALDGAGSLYIADTANQTIRRVDPAGIITTVAGTTLGNIGDGGLATVAHLINPHGVAVDSSGNLYIADANNDRVRRVDPNGIITTTAGLVDPEGMGPFARAHLADPRALVTAPPFTLVAGGSAGIIHAIRTGTTWLDAVAGRYPQTTATGALARFRDQSFGTIAGVAYDATAGLAFLTETTSNRVDVVTVVDPDDETTWTIAPLANTAGTSGFADGAAATARFRAPSGLFFDASAHQLYVADTGNHVIRAIDLSTGVAGATVHTVVGTAATLGFFGDGGVATSALLYAPQAITRCANGDLFVADTGNHRVRRVTAATNIISTVLGDGVPASSGEGHPASAFPVRAPLGLACDALGNLFVTSTTAVRLVPADANGVVDGTGIVETIYGAPPTDTFPASVTRCLTGLAVIDATTVQIVDSCTGLLVELTREPA
jgi:sugar lactone lactonase YvrE